RRRRSRVSFLLPPGHLAPHASHPRRRARRPGRAADAGVPRLPARSHRGEAGLRRTEAAPGARLHRHGRRPVWVLRRWEAGIYRAEHQAGGRRGLSSAAVKRLVDATKLAALAPGALLLPAAAQPIRTPPVSWQPQSSGVTARLRGVSAVSPLV